MEKRGFYTLKLTSRHEYPAEAKWAIFSAHTIGTTAIDDKRRIEIYSQQADKAIPKDCISLKVYMSGFQLYQYCLVKIAKRRGIKLTLMWYREDGWEEEIIKPCDYKQKLEDLKRLMTIRGFDTSKI